MKSAVNNKSINEPLRIFCLSAAHKHKNLECIPEVAYQLKKFLKKDFIFVLTLPPESKIFKRIHKASISLGISKNIVNKGYLNLDSVYHEYTISDCLFLPTLAEIFSATYIEAMAMNLPIVTTRLPFAEEICGSAALFYDPLNYEEAASQIYRILIEDKLKESLTLLGSQMLSKYPNQEEKYSTLFDFIYSCATKA